jgi:uncharacterized protein DUF4440
LTSGREITDTHADELRATEKARLHALVTGDIEAAGLLHADDFQLIPPGGGTISRNEYLDYIASGTIRYSLWEPEEIAVRIYGDAAVIRYRSELEITFDGRLTPRHHYWHTDRYERRDGRWQCVWSQATKDE